MFSGLFWGEGDSDDSMDSLKNKNIRQTELLVDMREAILQVLNSIIVLTVYCHRYMNFDS